LNRGTPQQAYRYLQIGKYSVCLDQSIFDALRTLGFGYAKYRLDSLGISGSRAWRAIAFVARSKFGLVDPEHCLILPVFGHLAMRVHRGHKVFCFTQSMVTKVFDREVSMDDAEAEVEACKTASAVSAAPKYLISDPGTAWFAEEYVCGKHATDTVALQSSDYLSYYADVEKCLIDLIRCQAPVPVGASTHIGELADQTHRNRWLKAGARSEEVDRITAYLGNLRIWLSENAGPQPLQLILTHGDFSLVNAIATANGLRFIDWEGIGRGSLFSDLFNFMFTEQYYARTSSRFTTEVDTIFRKFRDAVLSECPELSVAASLPPVFARRMFYLERLRLLLDRDVSKNLLGVIGKSIGIFEEFDCDVGDSPCESDP
jgi:hypothetical protein